MISETAQNVSIRIALSSGKAIQIKQGVDRFTVLDSGVLMIELGDYKVSYLTPSQWVSIEVMDKDALQRHQQETFGRRPNFGEEN
jgi:hypothetical protein